MLFWYLQALVQFPDDVSASNAKAALDGHAVYDGGYNKVKLHLCCCVEFCCCMTTAVTGSDVLTACSIMVCTSKFGTRPVHSQLCSQQSICHAILASGFSSQHSSFAWMHHCCLAFQMCDA